MTGNNILRDILNSRAQRSQAQPNLAICLTVDVKHSLTGAGGEQKVKVGMTESLMLSSSA